MLTVQRREEIRQYFLEHKSASGAELAKRFNVSNETIRRDFAVLEKEGFLARSFGGATMLDRMLTNVTNSMKSTLLVSSKRTIVERAARFIRPNDCLFLDHSTTVLTLCDLIKDMAIPLTLVTNSHQVIERLSACDKIHLISTGGIFNLERGGFFGLTTLDYIRNHNMDKAFLSCRTVDINRGLHDSDEQVAELRRTIVRNATASFLLVDHTKVGKSAFIATCDLKEVDWLITDQELSEDWHKALADKGVKVVDKAE